MKLNTKDLVFVLFLFTLLGNSFTIKSNPKYITPSENYHIVEKGDTLFSISREYSIPVEKLKLFNNLESSQIFVGQKIYLYPKVAKKKEYVTRREIPPSGYHQVKEGETVYRISKMYDIEIMDILEYNELKSFTIVPEQKIWLEPGHSKEISQKTPSTQTEKQESGEAKEKSQMKTNIPSKKQYHIVKKGETLFRISRKYSISVNKLKKNNNLPDNNIYPGQKIYLNNEAKNLKKEYAREENQSSINNEKKLICPLKGKLVSTFGLRHNKMHKGIDITAPIGEPIKAVNSGKVVFEGHQRGYGNVIVLEHDNFIMTVYAHNETNLVRLDELVKQGQPIATVGQTGNATGPHLHFEYRKKGKAIDPLTVLPNNLEDINGR